MFENCVFFIICCWSEQLFVEKSIYLSWIYILNVNFFKKNGIKNRQNSRLVSVEIKIISLLFFLNLWNKMLKFHSFCSQFSILLMNPTNVNVWSFNAIANSSVVYNFEPVKPYVTHFDGWRIITPDVMTNSVFWKRMKPELPDAKWNASSTSIEKTWWIV